MTSPSNPSILSLEGYMALPAKPATWRVTYGPDPSQFADLYLPASPGPYPVVIVIHGGCWWAKYALEPLGPLCAALAEDGCAVWSIEYRRIGNGGGWPNTFLDVGAATDAVRAVAADARLDLDRVVALGHSAGGHLALWLAGRHRLPVSSPLSVNEPLALRGVISLAGVADLAEAARRNVCDSAVADLLGAPPQDVPDRLAQTSPRELLPLGTPHWHLIGELDDTVPPELITAFAREAQAVEQAFAAVLPGAGHFDVVAPGSMAWPAVRDAVRIALA